MADRQEKIHLTLFFTRGVSLQTWDRVGMFAREVALYQRLQKHGVKVTFVTYGDRRDLNYTEQIPGIGICCNRWGLPLKIYEKLLPSLHRKVLAKTDLIKTNQTDGANLALNSARAFKKPLIARSGYLWSDFVARQRGKDSGEFRNSLKIEESVFCSSEHIIVATEAMRANILSRFPVLQKRITVLPNYVDADLFSPHKVESSGSKRLCYIGRLDQNQKNLVTLIEAVRGLEVGISVIGEGPLRSKIEKEMQRNPFLNLVGKIPHEELPQYLGQDTVFILPSFYEGHPKTLIEAMACGLPVIGTDVPGINDLIRHGETGWLCKTDAASLRTAILKVLADSDLRERLGRNARKHVLDHFALDRIVGDELELYDRVLGLGHD
jgi:glycosyltransferase involved in cell wall biosynthesis